MRRGWLNAVALVLGFLFGAIAMAGWRWDWSAAAALATVSAVIVALIPIWHAEGRRRQQARVLRVRLMEPLSLLSFALSQALQGAEGVPDVVRFDMKLVERMRLLRSLIPKATHLDADEFERLMAVYDAMVVPLATRGIQGDRASDLLRLINEATSLLGRRARIRRQNPVGDERQQPT